MINYKPFFKVIFPIEQQRFLEIPEGRSIIGRGLSADIRLNDDLVSREHCEIFHTDIGLRIRDLHSTNGTFINYSEVPDAILKNGDHIQLGATILKIIFQAESDLTETFTEHDIFSKEHFISCAHSFITFASRNKTPLALIDLNISTTPALQLPKSLMLKLYSLINNEKTHLHLLHAKKPLQFKILLSGISEETAYQEATIFAEAIKNHHFFWNDSSITMDIQFQISFFDSIDNSNKQNQILDKLRDCCAES